MKKTKRVAWDIHRVGASRGAGAPHPPAGSVTDRDDGSVFLSQNRVARVQGFNVFAFSC